MTLSSPHARYSTAHTPWSLVRALLNAVTARAKERKKSWRRVARQEYAIRFGSPHAKRDKLKFGVSFVFQAFFFASIASLRFVLVLRYCISSTSSNCVFYSAAHCRACSRNRSQSQSRARFTSFAPTQSQFDRANRDATVVSPWRLCIGKSRAKRGRIADPRGVGQGGHFCVRGQPLSKKSCISSPYFYICCNKTELLSWRTGHARLLRVN